MHIHANQTNPNLQLDALYAAEKASAKREVEKTRRKLLEFASQLAGEAGLGEDCVVRLEAKQESQEKPKQRNTQNQASQNEERSFSKDTGSTVSDWA
jgi:hypothetical protein